MWPRARAGGRASGCVASSVWAISRPLPGKHFLKEWDFSRGVVTQDGDHFLFADFVVAIAAFVDGLDDRFELFLRDHGLFFFWVWMGRPGCEAEYKIVTIEACDVVRAKVHCLRCDAMFPAGEGRVAFKYFLVGRPSRRNRRRK
jgi:hypothetical protein